MEVSCLNQFLQLGTTWLRTNQHERHSNSLITAVMVFQRTRFWTLKTTPIFTLWFKLWTVLTQQSWAMQLCSCTDCWFQRPTRSKNATTFCSSTRRTTRTFWPKPRSWRDCKTKLNTLSSRGRTVLKRLRMRKTTWRYDYCYKFRLPRKDSTWQRLELKLLWDPRRTTNSNNCKLSWKMCFEWIKIVRGNSQNDSF